MTSLDVITSFYQQGENDCATIGTIKTAIATFQIGNIFSADQNAITGVYTITFKNSSTLSASSNDIDSLKNKSGFALNFDLSDDIKKSIYEYALFCFSVFVLNYAKINSISSDDALHAIDDKGIKTDFSYKYLGFNNSDITFLTGDAGIKDPTSLSVSGIYLLYNSFHAVMASDDQYDENGTATNISEFIKNHSTLFNGKKVWAYKFNNK